MLPVDAPAGTATVIAVSLQDDAVAAVPLNVTVLVACVTPRFVPVIVTVAPTCALDGIADDKVGAGTTVNVTALLARPATVTVTGPVVTPAGAVAEILVAVHAVATAAVPLNVIVLAPCVAPKFDPTIVTNVPVPPDEGDTVVTIGATVNAAPLL